MLTTLRANKQHGRAGVADGSRPLGDELSSPASEEDASRQHQGAALAGLENERSFEQEERVHLRDKERRSSVCVCVGGTGSGRTLTSCAEQNGGETATHVGGVDGPQAGEDVMELRGARLKVRQVLSPASCQQLRTGALRGRREQRKCAHFEGQSGWKHDATDDDSPGRPVARSRCRSRRG